MRLDGLRERVTELVDEAFAELDEESRRTLGEANRRIGVSVAEAARNIEVLGDALRRAAERFEEMILGDSMTPDPERADEIDAIIAETQAMLREET